ncbi:cation diffusion facilitator family transporter [Aspergillus clavatus NRRL 1]|uniref:Cation diffusion facilitator, putative n=1 Tax=Aspergillus clavatus (strain ATCC 1007 / CBS 513.65 / DSM 816 / NCTC 3887 / NRRL 1 / QM 1276 / 107) TaxID=344612 RepID=A1CN51_ASPCL|nr:cation diffusion facilitator, putative [Aspergillus clavatus NRRL 1]EAW08988.1 cation diffusion facilitator, putative [Aspergillus clavatus NRRL 1]
MSRPASPSPSECRTPARRPSLEPEREILATRGQSLPGLLRRRSLSVPPSTARGEYIVEYGDGAPFRDRHGSIPVFLRGMTLIGASNTMYQWHRYYKSPEELKGMKKKIRKFYERTNQLVSQYLYIDQLLDSSLPHRLIEEYDHDHANGVHHQAEDRDHNGDAELAADTSTGRIKRTPRNLYRVPDERSPLLPPTIEEDAPYPPVASPEDHEFVNSGDRIVTIAIYINFIANVLLLAAKIAVMTLTSSMSVLASLVDGALDFLSTVIVWTTTKLVQRQDRDQYPISRRRLEPLSILVFAVVMATSFVQVAITSLGRLLGSDHELVTLSLPSIIIMASTVVVKLLCWFWCRLIKNSSVQALAQDAMTDVIFNLFSILFPLVGHFAEWWFLDPLGGLLLSIYIIWNWSGTATEHIRHLTGAAASPTDHSVLLYMTMRFSKIIWKIQDLKAYYAGDHLNVEVDIVLDEGTSLRDGHDVGESLQYMLESVPTVERAFVHLDYDPWNIPSHMNQLEA